MTKKQKSNYPNEVALECSFLSRRFMFIWIAVCLIILPNSQAVAADASAIKRGAYIFTAAGCAHCHTAKKGPENYLAGGRKMPTPFGDFYSPNITPDKTTGIGNWTGAEFKRALREGKRPDGAYYFPAFPYAAYTAMTDKDVADLWTYLQSLPGIERKNKPHDISAPFSWRWLVFFWRFLYFDEGALAKASGKSDIWKRGQYLTEALGHCAECHSPRNPLGGIIADKRMAGGALYKGSKSSPEIAPNITPHKNTGIGNWTVEDLDAALTIGMLPDGDFLGSDMAAVIENTAKLSEADRKAMIFYLQSLAPIDHDPAKK